MLERVYMIKYVLGTILDDDEIRDIIAIGITIHVMARVASKYIVGNFMLWWAVNNIADVCFIAIPIALAVRSLWAFININDLFSKEEIEEMEEVL